MKIAFLNIYNGVVNRGAETFVKELAGRLSKNHQVTVFQAGDREGKEVYKIQKVSIKFDPDRKDFTDRFLRRVFLDYQNRVIFLFTLKSLLKILKERYDIVISVNGGFMPAILRIVTWLYGGKMIISGQSGIGWDDRNNLWCFPDVFVALSEKAKNWAKKVNPFVKVVEIANGVDLEKFKLKTQKSKVKNKFKTVLAVGAFVKSKRLELAIEAVSRLKGTKLVIAGGRGDLKDKIYDLGIKKLGKDRFKILSLPFERMPEVYQEADVFTLPSESSEAFGNVLVEAMACSLPVVATDDPIRREIVGNAGILVDPTDIDSYAKALDLALSRDWKDVPRLQAKKFDWDIIAQKYEKLFRSLGK
jgi:glycosyltransferase involved in cell wall biosynthesis